MLKFVICINNKDYEASLEKWKIYPILKEGEVKGYIRVIDESGEDYLYPEEYFLPIELPTIVYEKLKKEYEKFYKHQLNLKEVSIRLLNIIETLPENL